MLKKVYFLLDRFRMFIIIAVFSLMILLCAVQVILRYFTPASLKPFAWGDEIIRLSSIWVAFMAASLAAREGFHLSVDYFVQRILSEKAIIIVKKMAGVAVLAVLAIIVWFSVAQTQLNIASKLQNLPMSMAWFYAAIPVGCSYLLLDYLLILIYGRHPFAGDLLLSASEREQDGTEDAASGREGIA